MMAYIDFISFSNVTTSGEKESITLVSMRTINTETGKHITPLSSLTSDK